MKSPISTNDLDKITSTIALAMQQGFAQLTASLSQPKTVAAQAKTSAYRYGTDLLEKQVDHAHPQAWLRLFYCQAGR